MMNDKPRQAPTEPAAPSTPAEARRPSSPVCYAHEMGSLNAGYLYEAELVELLNTLLEGERAGDKLAQAFLRESPSAEATVLLTAVKRDEARFAAMLERLIERLGNLKPSARVGDFYDMAMAIEGFAARLAFLNRGQSWVVRKLQGALPRH